MFGADITVWQAISGIVVLLVTQIGGQVFKFFREWLRDRRDREIDLQKQEYLKRIADVSDRQNEKLDKIATAQIEAKLTLDTVVDKNVFINKTRHDELVSAIKSSCRHN